MNEPRRDARDCGQERGRLFCSERLTTKASEEQMSDGNSVTPRLLLNAMKRSGACDALGNWDVQACFFKLLEENIELMGCLGSPFFPGFIAEWQMSKHPFDKKVRKRSSSQNE